MDNKAPELTPEALAAAETALAEKAARATELQLLLDAFARIHDHAARCKFFRENPRLAEVYSAGNFN